MSAKRTAIIALLVAGSLAFGYGIWSRAEWKTVELGMSANARANPMLAMQRVAERLGLHAQSENLLTDDPAPSEVLVLNAGVRSTPPPRVESLLEWAADGEHLIIALLPSNAAGGDGSQGRFDHPSERHLLHRLGVTVNWHEPDGAWPWLDNEDALAVSLPSTLAPLELAASSRPYLSGVREGVSLRDNGCLVLAGDENNEGVIVSFPLEAGWVTLLISGEFWENEALGKLDHGALGWQLLHLHGNPARVRFVTRVAYPGLLDTLLRKAPLALACLAILVALAIWRGGARFGPLVGLPALERRDFSEHIAAAGKFAWRIDGGRSLIDALERDLGEVHSEQRAEEEVRELFRDRERLAGDPKRFTRLVRKLANMRLPT